MSKYGATYRMDRIEIVAANQRVRHSGPFFTPLIFIRYSDPKNTIATFD